MLSLIRKKQYMFQRQRDAVEVSLERYSKSFHQTSVFWLEKTYRQFRFSFVNTACLKLYKHRLHVLKVAQRKLFPIATKVTGPIFTRSVFSPLNRRVVHLSVSSGHQTMMRQFCQTLIFVVVLCQVSSTTPVNKTTVEGKIFISGDHNEVILSTSQETKNALAEIKSELNSLSERDTKFAQ